MFLNWFFKMFLKFFILPFWKSYLEHNIVWENYFLEEFTYTVVKRSRQVWGVWEENGVCLHLTLPSSLKIRSWTLVVEYVFGEDLG